MSISPPPQTPSVQLHIRRRASKNTDVKNKGADTTSGDGSAACYKWMMPSSNLKKKSFTIRGGLTVRYENKTKKGLWLLLLRFSDFTLKFNIHPPSTPTSGAQMVDVYIYGSLLEPTQQINGSGHQFTTGSTDPPRRPQFQQIILFLSPSTNILSNNQYFNFYARKKKLN